MSRTEVWKKKLMLAKMKEAGKVSLAEDEYWFDHSDDEEKIAKSSWF